MDKKNIMVFRFSAMGDVAMSVPVLKAVTEQNEGVKIIMVSRPFFAPLFKDLPEVDFVPADFKNKYKGITGLLKLYKDLKKYPAGYLADLHDVLRTKILRKLFVLNGKKIAHIDKGRKEKKALTREKNKIFKALKSTHERYADVFRKLGFEVDLSQVDFLEKPALSSHVSLFLENFKEGKLIGIAPFAAHEGKQYPLEKIKEVIRLLLEKDPELNILLLGGGKEEKKKLDELEKINRNRVVNIAGIFPFEEELQIISRLDSLLSMDSGNGHLAALYGVPVISLWGATHPFAGFVPFGQAKENQILPDRKKYPQLPVSIYGNKTFEGFEKVWDDIKEEEVVRRLLSPRKPVNFV